MKRQYRPWTPDKSALLLDLLGAGHTVIKAAEIMGTDRRAIYQHMKNIGIAPPNGNRPYSKTVCDQYHLSRWPGARAESKEMTADDIAFMLKNQHIMARKSWPIL